MDYTVCGILQARILEWAAFPFSRGSSQPKDWTQVSCIAVDSFLVESWATGKPLVCSVDAYPSISMHFCLEISNFIVCLKLSVVFWVYHSPSIHTFTCLYQRKQQQCYNTNTLRAQRENKRRCNFLISWSCQFNQTGRKYSCRPIISHLHLRMYRSSLNRNQDHSVSDSVEIQCSSFLS